MKSNTCPDFDFKKYVINRVNGYTDRSIFLCKFGSVTQKIVDNSVLPEFILFHKFSRQKLFFYKQLKQIIKESNYYISTELTYSKMRVGNFTSPTYATIFLKPKKKIL